jgi:hypothetical protein
MCKTLKASADNANYGVYRPPAEAPSDQFEPFAYLTIQVL